LTPVGDEELESPDAIQKWSQGTTVFWTREPKEGEHAWADISCKVCYMKPIVGNRYGCADRECGYDLCEECHNKQTEQHEHGLIKFLVPKQKYTVEELLADVVDGRLIDKNNQHVTIDSLKNKCLGIYFTAEWSKPSLEFTPKLSEVYQEAVNAQLPFDIIFISADRDQATYDKNYNEMPWKALPYDNQITKLKLKCYFSLRGLPSLVIIKPDGEFLTKSGKRAIEKKKLEAVQAWCKGEQVVIPQTVPEEYVWQDVTCDGCGTVPLVGLRHYCKTCTNYDLCSTCKEKGHEHELTVVPQPDDDDDED